MERGNVSQEDDEFRALLDQYGILRRGAMEAPPRSKAFMVFAQRRDARVEAEVWRRHAAQFFDTELELALPKRYIFDAPPADAARIRLTGPDGLEKTRLCFGRPREDDDLKTADEVDTRQGAAGLGRLAQRCSTVWLVVTEGDTDEAALRLAAILASVVLGPILSPDGQELFGVRTARAKLEGTAAPYR